MQDPVEVRGQDEGLEFDLVLPGQPAVEGVAEVLLPRKFLADGPVRLFLPPEPPRDGRVDEQPRLGRGLLPVVRFLRLPVFLQVLLDLLQVGRQVRVDAAVQVGEEALFLTDLTVVFPDGFVGGLDGVLEGVDRLSERLDGRPGLFFAAERQLRPQVAEPLFIPCDPSLQFAGAVVFDALREVRDPAVGLGKQPFGDLLLALAALFRRLELIPKTVDLLVQLVF